jgi:formiminotetrahydrofolate cyclodeaminase
MNWDRNDIGAFLKVLDPEENETGGGTASAVAGAMAAGLAGMVARVSIGKKEMEPEEYYREIDAAAQNLTADLFHGGQEDSRAFGSVMKAFGMPRETDDEKAERSAAIQAGMVGAARVPLANAERCARVLELVGRLEGRSNPNAGSDLAVARSLATTALEGCLANVEINLTSIRDEGVRDELGNLADALRAAVAAGSVTPEGDADV